jgi:hypothetical protein
MGWTTEKSLYDSLRDKGFVSNPKVQTGSRTHQFFSSKSTGKISLVVKPPRHEAVHSPPPVGGIKNEWSHTFTPSYALMLCKGITLPLIHALQSYCETINI